MKENHNQNKKEPNKECQNPPFLSYIQIVKDLNS